MQIVARPPNPPLPKYYLFGFRSQADIKPFICGFVDQPQTRHPGTNLLLGTTWAPGKLLFGSSIWALFLNAIPIRFSFHMPLKFNPSNFSTSSKLWLGMWNLASNVHFIAVFFISTKSTVCSFKTHFSFGSLDLLYTGFNDFPSFERNSPRLSGLAFVDHHYRTLLFEFSGNHTPRSFSLGAFAWANSYMNLPSLDHSGDHHLVRDLRYSTEPWYEDSVLTLSSQARKHGEFFIRAEWILNSRNLATHAFC